MGMEKTCMDDCKHFIPSEEYGEEDELGGYCREYVKKEDTDKEEFTYTEIKDGKEVVYVEFVTCDHFEPRG